MCISFSSVGRPDLAHEELAKLLECFSSVDGDELLICEVTTVEAWTAEGVLSSDSSTSADRRKVFRGHANCQQCGCYTSQKIEEVRGSIDRGEVEPRTVAEQPPYASSTSTRTHDPVVASMSSSVAKNIAGPSASSSVTISKKSTGGSGSNSGAGPAKSKEAALAISDLDLLHYVGLWDQLTDVIKDVMHPIGQLVDSVSDFLIAIQKKVLYEQVRDSTMTILHQSVEGDMDLLLSVDEVWGYLLSRSVRVNLLQQLCVTVSASRSGVFLASSENIVDERSVELFNNYVHQEGLHDA